MFSATATPSKLLAYADELRDGTGWRRQLRAVAWRQGAGGPGCRDSDLLSLPRFVRVRSGHLVLMYGRPALLIAPRAAPGLLCRLDCYQRVLALSWVRANPDEHVLVSRLRRDLTRLTELAAVAAPRLVFAAAMLENDDGRASQARPSRSPPNLYQAWPPASGRRMTPCELV
jgi:hypothetical protein